ncbi:MAG: type II toxin-antitoxin system Phd/YefM family antitoxin [Gammaproteobacteria bacterium]|nr:type II toxin-antitoxin system Phd/YefM family antitoxin [Gammaproteobacteria bacterium]
MILVNTHEAKTKLSKLLSMIERSGETVRICRHGAPIADLVPIIKVPNPLQRNQQLAKVNILPQFYQSLADSENE